MGLFDLLAKESPNRVFLSLLLGIIAGLSFAFLMPMILTSIEVPDSRLMQPTADTTVSVLSVQVSNYRFALGYLVLFVVILLMKSSSQILMSNVAIDATKNLRLKLYKQISMLHIRDIETIGQSRLIVALTADVPRIIAGVKILPIVMINTVTILGLLGFLVYLNVQVFLLILATIFVAILTYRLPILFGEKLFRRSRNYYDYLQESIRGLIMGAKELKLNDTKRDTFFSDNLVEYEDKVAKTDKKAWTTMFLAITYGDLISFFVIGVVVYVIRNYYAIDTVELVGIIMALLYAKGPIAEMLNVLPAIPSARVSLSKVNHLFEGYTAETYNKSSVPIEAWDSISLSALEFTYDQQTQSGFSIGPIDLELERGEITFIVGGNGSGKSTLAKVISLLYSPQAGSIAFGDQVIGTDNIGSYRQLISAIYLDFYLFDKILDQSKSDSALPVGEYLSDLQLDHKVTVTDNQFSTTDLSDGQKKRLALLASFMEDRSLYVFDEWAADQDPEFKAVFYSKIISELKSRGKTVVIVTHDDRYFGYADKIVTMENGRIRSIERGTERADSTKAAVSQASV